MLRRRSEHFSFYIRPLRLNLRASGMLFDRDGAIKFSVLFFGFWPRVSLLSPSLPLNQWAAAARSRSLLRRPPPPWRRLQQRHQLRETSQEEANRRLV